MLFPMCAVFDGDIHMRIIYTSLVVRLQAKGMQSDVKIQFDIPVFSYTRVYLKLDT